MKRIELFTAVICLTVGALLFTMTKASAFASVPYTFACDKDAGFVMDPNVHKKVGYVTSLNGFALSAALKPDLTVHVPGISKSTLTYTPLAVTWPTPVKPLPTASVVGVIEKFNWNGGVGDALQIDFYVSQQNATLIKALQQSVLTNTKVTALGWWIADYDQETKQWYEQSFPKAPTTITGVISGKDNPELSVNLSPVPVKDGIEVNVYKVTIHVVPAANQAYTLHFANSATKPVVKSWGLQVGTLATPQVGH